MNILIDVKVSDNLKVRDFEIIDGLVFLCGESSGGSGFLGWFDINDLFYAGGTAQIDQTLSALGLLTLDNIEVYHDTTGAIRIAGYGVYSYYALNVTLYRAFEAVGTPVAGMQYRTMDLWCAGPFADIADLTVTDNFVVYLSRERIARLNNDIVISIDGLEYESQTHRYIILHRHETSAGVDEHAITTANYLSGVPTFFESSYQTTFNTSSMWMPTNICVDGYLNYTVVGYDMVSMEYIFWRNSAATVAGNCDRMVQYPVVPLPLEDEKCYACNVKPTTWTPLLFYGLGNERAEYPCIKICD